MKPVVRTLSLAVLVAALFAAVAAVQARQRRARADAAPDAGPTSAPSAETARPEVPEGERLVALDAGLAEAVCMLGLGDRLVARSASTDFPESLAELPVVMGTDGAIDFDALAAARPALVLLTEAGMSAAHAELASRRISHLAVRTGTLPDLCQGIFELGTRFGADEAAGIWLEQIEQRTARAADAVSVAVSRAGGRTPSVLIVLGRLPTVPATVVVAGRDSFHQGVLEGVGLPNACEATGSWVALSVDEAAALAPDIVLEVRPSAADAAAAVVGAATDWAPFPAVPAVRARAVFAVAGAWALRAGPRVDGLYGLLADCADSWASRVSAP